MSEFFGPEQQRELDRLRADSGYAARELSAEEREIIERKRQALAELFQVNRVVATYKIEINFDKRRSNAGHYPGSLIVFHSGSAFDGGGDEPMFPCPDDHCSGFIPQKLVSQMMRIAVCPKCRCQWPQGQLYDMRMFRLPVAKWATVLARYFIRLGSDADIYLKYHPEDIRVQTIGETERFRGGETVNRVRGKRQKVLYSLHAIYRDLSHGADLEARFRAFLEA